MTRAGGGGTMRFGLLLNTLVVRSTLTPETLINCSRISGPRAAESASMI